MDLSRYELIFRLQESAWKVDEPQLDVSDSTERPHGIGCFAPLKCEISPFLFDHETDLSAEELHSIPTVILDLSRSALVELTAMTTMLRACM